MTNKDHSSEQEQLHHALFDQALDAIMITDLEGNILEVNDAVCSQFGYTRAELLGKNVRLFMSPDELDQNPIRFELLEEGGQTLNERKIRHKEGHVIYVETNAKMYGKDKVLIIAHNVSERVRKFDLLRKSEKDIRAILEHTQIAFVLLDANLRVITHNDFFESKYSFTEKQFVKEGSFFIDAVQPERRETVLANLNDVLKGNRHEYETTYPLEDGTRISLIINETPVIENDGKILGVCISVFDNTDRKQIETELRTSEANLKTIFQTTDTAYILVDKEFNVLSYNDLGKAFCEQEFGKQVLTGTYLFDYFPPWRKAEWEKHTPEVFNGKTIGFETCYKHEDGSESWFYKKFFPVYDSAYDILGLMLSVNDITKRKESERAMEDQINLLKELSFITSHELRHEYAKLYSIIDVLHAEGRLGKEEQELIGEGLRSFEKINSIIYKLNDKITFGDVVEFDNTQAKKAVEHILLIDDDSMTNKLNFKSISKEFPGEQIHLVSSVDEGLKHLQEHDKNGHYLILLDLNMPDKNGWDFLEAYKQFPIQSPVIILSSSIEPKDKERAKQFAVVRNFFSKPLQRAALVPLLK